MIFCKFTAGLSVSLEVNNNTGINRNYVGDEIQARRTYSKIIPKHVAESPGGGNGERRVQVGQVAGTRASERGSQIRAKSEGERKKPLHPSSSGLRYVTRLESWHCVTNWCQDEWRRKEIFWRARIFLSIFTFISTLHGRRKKLCLTLPNARNVKWEMKMISHLLFYFFVAM